MAKTLKAVITVLLLTIVVFTTYFITEDVLGKSPATWIRALGQFYLNNTYNIYNKTWWSGSPEVITAILWDYRGLDTVFEITVLYIAVIGCAVLAYKPLINFAKIKKYSEEYGLTLIVKTSVKIVMVLIALVAVNLALRGYISPGGGFAGGVAYAIAPLIIIAAYSIYYLLSMGFSLIKSSILRSIGLTVIIIVALLPLIYEGFILQNQLKTYALFPGYPINVGIFYIGGMLIFMNTAQFIIVSMEFIMVLILISLYMRGEKHDT